jgi:outer membrane protein assembly factor BamB
MYAREDRSVHRWFLRAVLVLALAALPPHQGRAGDWPGWRGPTGLGYTEEKDLPLTWDAKTGKNVLWKTLLHGGVRNNPEFSSPGWSCPIVWGDRLFLTTAVWPQGMSQEERRKSIPEHHVLCFDAGDGRQLWDSRVQPGPVLVDNFYHGYAVPTPVADGEHVFVVFGSGVVAALDFDGKIVWREELPRNKDIDGGICSSPVLHKDSLILVGIANPGLRALEKKTGRIKWEQKTRDHNRQATPVLLRIEGKLQLIHCAGGVQGLDPDTGELIWNCRAPAGLSSPVFGCDLVYTDPGRGNGEGAAVDPRGKGDVGKTNVKWKMKLSLPAGSSGIVVGPHLYRVCGNDFLRCFEMASGEQVFEERLQRISPSASPIATPEGRLYFASSGRSYVLKAGPKLEVLATNDLGEGDPYTTPAVARGRLYIKGRNYLWCIGEK